MLASANDLLTPRLESVIETNVEHIARFVPKLVLAATIFFGVTKIASRGNLVDSVRLRLIM